MITLPRPQKSLFNKRYSNGRISGTLDEEDRKLIKAFCSHNRYPLRSEVDLKRNKCLIYCEHQGQEVLLGTIEKVVYKKTFDILQPFRLYLNRQPGPDEKPAVIMVPEGTRVFLSEDLQHFWIPVPTEQEWVKAPRWVVVRNTSIRQVRSLMLINEQEGIGLKDNMQRIDLVELLGQASSSSVALKSRAS